MGANRVKTFFTSDSHYGHKNIVETCSSWPDKRECRPFKSVEEMNDELVNGINSVVRADDVLYHCGDFNFGGLKNQREFRSRLVCENIHLVLGNHDFNHGSIDPATVDHRFTSVSNYKEIMVEGQMIVLSHYAFRVWNNQSKGAWNLYGHSHGMLKHLNNKSMDVGPDFKRKQNWPNVYQPWEFSELQNVFFHESIRCEDGHTKDDLNPPFKA